MNKTLHVRVKASRWLSATHTPSLCLLDLLGLGACVGLGKMGLYTPRHTQTHTHAHASVL